MTKTICWAIAAALCLSQAATTLAKRQPLSGTPAPNACLLRGQVVKYLGIRVRVEPQTEEVQFNTQDLRAHRGLGSSDFTAMARADRDRDGWVSSSDLGDLIKHPTDPRSGSFIESMVRDGRWRAQGPGCIGHLRRKPWLARPPAPPRLSVSKSVMSGLPRQAFVPLADHIIGRFADAKPFEFSGSLGASSFTLTEYAFDATDLVKKYSKPELQAALAILGDRHGVEFALSRKGKKYMMVQAESSIVAFDEQHTGTEQVFHVHSQRVGADVHPSDVDFVQTNFRKQNKAAGVVGPEGWAVDYALRDGKPWLGASRPLWAQPTP